MPQIAGFKPDTWRSDDLSIEADVNALARLMLSRNVAPPLSIGVFSPEGSGKTFFTQRLSQAVSEIAFRANEAPASAYCSQLVQVGYNAWHYMGANQWLGLVERIFIELDHWWAREHPTEAEGFAPVSTARKLLRDLKSQVERAHRLRAEAEAAMHEATLDHRKSVRAHAACIAKSRWPEINRLFSERISCNDDDVHAIDQAGERLGLKELTLNAEQLDQIFEQAKTLSGRASLLTSSLKAKRFVGNVLLGVLGGLLIGIFFVLIAKLYASDPKTSVEVIGKILTAVSTLVGFIGIWVAAMLRNRAAQAIDALQKFQPRLREVVQEVDSTLNFEKAINQERVTTSQSELEENRGRVAEAARGVVLAEQAVADFMAEGPLRRVSAHYRTLIQSSDPNLSAGIVPTIREDFESLTRAVAPGHHESSVGSTLERVVVFIDDLDQCPPRVAITVLQAVYLLLAFPLFVVVITADPRWLIAALKSNYTALVKDEIELSSSRDSIDFLSKIIQIPFWLPPVSRLSAEIIVEALTSPPPEMTSEPEVSHEPLTVDIAPDVLESPVETVELDDFSEGSITEGEIDSLKRIGGVIGNTPRDVKRLINIYRLVRYTLSPTSFAAFIGSAGNPPQYPAVITGLAIVTAAPDGAPYFFRELDELPATDLSHFLLKSRPSLDQPADWEVILRILDAYRASTEDAKALDNLRSWRHLVTRYSFTVPPPRVER